MRFLLVEGGSVFLAEKETDTETDYDDTCQVFARGDYWSGPYRAEMTRRANAWPGMLAALLMAEKEIRSPGACRQEHGKDIADFLEEVIDDATPDSEPVECAPIY